VNRGEVPAAHLRLDPRHGPDGDVSDRHAELEIELPHGVQTVDGVDNARLAVREQVQHGADWIKYYSDRRYYFTPDSVLHSGELHRCRSQGNRGRDAPARRMVAAHAIGSDGIAAALRAGVNSIEHGDGLTDSLMDAMVKNNVYWVPTVTVGVHVLPRGGVWPALVNLERRAFGRALRRA